jgi:hypothetical protein
LERLLWEEGTSRLTNLWFLAGCPPLPFSDDPDSNLLEYIAMLDDEPQPELGLLLSWSEWLSGRKKAK